MNDNNNNNENEWIAYEDDEGRGTYYYNAATGESSWEAPSDAIIVKPPEEEENEGAETGEVIEVTDSIDHDDDGETHGDAYGDDENKDVEMENANKCTNNESESGRDNNNDDDDNDDHNYHDDDANLNASKSIFEDDEPKDEEKSELDVPKSSTSLRLPSGWIELIDDSSGLPYYYNEDKNITTWDRPTADDGDADDDDHMHDNNEEELSPRTENQSPHILSPSHPSPSIQSPQSPVGHKKENDRSQQHHPAVAEEEESQQDTDKSIEEPIKDPKEVRLTLAKEALAKPDALLEPDTVGNVLTLVTDDPKNGPNIAMKSLVSTYGCMVSQKFLILVISST